MSSSRYTLLRVFINKTWLRSVRQIRLGLAWLGSTRQNRLGLARLEALLQGTVPIFGIDVSCTCPRTLARLGLGLGLGQLSPSDEFGKLKSGVIGLGWIIIIFYS